MHKAAAVPDKLGILNFRTDNFAQLVMLLYAENFCMEGQGREVRVEKVEIHGISRFKFLAACKKDSSCTDVPYSCSNV